MHEHIRDRTPDDDPASVSILNGLNPQEPPMTVKGWRGNLNTLPAHVKHAILVADKDGVVGMAQAVEMFWVEDPGGLAIDVSVAPEHQSRGWGTALYDRLMETIQPWEPKRLYARVREDRDETRNFAEKRGYMDAGHVGRNSRLNVNAANLEGYDRLAEALAEQGIRVARMSELGADDEEQWRTVHHVQMTSARDEPSAETYSMPFESWRDSFLSRPGMSAETIWVALDGDRPVGVTMMQRVGETGSLFGMGVLREYRGRGIARLLKLRQLEWSRQNGIHYLYTSNDENNPRMYDINVRMGYEPLPGTVTMVRRL